MSKRKVAQRFLGVLETRAVKGATEVWFQGCSGQGLKVFRGGPLDALQFRQTFAEILQDNAAGWTVDDMSAMVRAVRVEQLERGRAWCQRFACSTGVNGRTCPTGTRC